MTSHPELQTELPSVRWRKYNIQKHTHTHRGWGPKIDAQIESHMLNGVTTQPYSRCNKQDETKRTPQKKMLIRKVPEDSMHGKTCLQQQPKDEQALVISSHLKTPRLHTVLKGRTLVVCYSNSIHIWERWLTQKEEWQDRTQWVHTTPSGEHLNYFKAVFLVQMTSQL